MRYSRTGVRTAATAGNCGERAIALSGELARGSGPVQRPTVREKSARLICVRVDLTDAKRLHHGPPLKNRDYFRNMRSILDYGSFQYRLKQSLPLFLYDFLGFALRVL
jgi:hypothetical protein